MAKSLNRAQLIGNLTRDPELRYTPNGTAVCSFGLATNRTWKTETGEKKDEAEFHNIVAWSKLAEICSQFLVKGRKVFVEGRIATRKWTGQDGAARSITEIVISDMILLDNKRIDQAGQTAEPNENPSVVKDKEKNAPSESEALPVKETKAQESKSEKQAPKEDHSGEDVSSNDIPF